MNFFDVPVSWGLLAAALVTIWSAFIGLFVQSIDMTNCQQSGFTESECVLILRGLPLDE